MARLNFLNLDLPVQKGTFSWIQASLNMMDTVESKMEEEPVADWLSISQQNGIDMRKELEWMKQQKVKTRIVFSHNDPNMGNILVDPTDPSNIMMVDMHISSFGFRGSDLGTFFMFSMMDLTKPDLKSGVDFPSKERMVLFINSYLDEYKKLKPDLYDPELDSIDIIMKESMLYGAAYTMLFVVWVARDAEDYIRQFPALVVSDHLHSV